MKHKTNDKTSLTELSSNPNVIHLLENTWTEFVGIILSENICIIAKQYKEFCLLYNKV